VIRRRKLNPFLSTSYHSDSFAVRLVLSYAAAFPGLGPTTPHKPFPVDREHTRCWWRWGYRKTAYRNVSNLLQTGGNGSDRWQDSTWDILKWQHIKLSANATQEIARWTKPSLLDGRSEAQLFSGTLDTQASFPAPSLSTEMSRHHNGPSPNEHTASRRAGHFGGLVGAGGAAPASGVDSITVGGGRQERVSGGSLTMADGNPVSQAAKRSSRLSSSPSVNEDSEPRLANTALFNYSRLRLGAMKITLPVLVVSQIFGTGLSLVAIS